MGHLVESGRQTFVQHLPVPVHAQLAGQPLQLAADGIGDRPVQDLAEGLEGAAHPAGGDAHAVDGVLDVLAYGGIELDDRVPLGTDVREYVVARGHGILYGRGGGLLRGGLGQGTPELRRRLRRPYTCLAQPLLHLVEEGRVDAVRQLHLDLGPLGTAVPADEPLRVYGVHADLGQHPAVGVHEVAHVTVGTQPDHGRQLGVPHPGADKAGEDVGQGVGQRGLDLVPYPRSDGELQMPARVGASGSATQGDRRRVEALVRGVVVGGVQMRDTLVDDGLDPGDAGQIGQAAVVGLILPLDFALHVRHDPNLMGVGPG